MEDLVKGMEVACKIFEISSIGDGRYHSQNQH